MNDNEGAVSKELELCIVVIVLFIYSAFHIAELVQFVVNNVNI